MKMKRYEDLNIRAPFPGDLGWILQSHAQYYAQKNGWQKDFEAIVAKIILDYLTFKPAEMQACFIAELLGKPIGSVMLTQHNIYTGKIRVLFVNEKARGNGIGFRLMNEALKKARIIGYQKLTLWTTSNQTSARNLYKKIGFQIISSQMNNSFARDCHDEEWELNL